MPYTKPRKESFIPQVRPQLFQAESIKQSLSFPSLPPHVCALRRRSRHRQPTARGVPAGTPSRVICVCLPFTHHLVPPLSLFPFPYLSPLSSQAKPNMLPNPRKRNPSLVPKFHLLWVSLFRFLQSRPVDQPHMYVFGYVCTDTKQHLSMATGARVEVPSTSSSTREFPCSCLVKTTYGRALPSPLTSKRSGSSAGWRLPFLPSMTSWRQEVAWSP